MELAVNWYYGDGVQGKTYVIEIVEGKLKFSLGDYSKRDKFSNFCGGIDDTFCCDGSVRRVSGRDYEVFKCDGDIFTLFAWLCQQNAMITFKHNLRKIRSESYNKTHFFKKDEEVKFINTPVSVYIRKMKFRGNCILVEYEIEGNLYYFEIARFDEDTCYLNEFYVVLKPDISIPGAVKDLGLQLERELTENNLYTLNREYSLCDYASNDEEILDILKGVASRYCALSCGIDALDFHEMGCKKFIEARTSTPKFGEGIEIKTYGRAWGLIRNNSYVFDLEKLKKCESLDGFVALLELNGSSDYYLTSRADAFFYPIFKALKNKELSSEDCDNLRLDFTITRLILYKFINMYLSTFGFENIWLENDRGILEVITKGE